MTAARYKLRADAFFVKSDDGVWIRNNRGSFLIGGRTAYPLVKRLFARLEDGATLDEICGNIGAEQRSAVEAIVRRFEQHGFAKRVVAPAEEIPDWASRLYDDQLRFIDHHLDTPFARFAAFREKRTVCVGDDAVLRATLTALVEYGAAHVLAIVRAGTDLAPLAALAAAAQRRDPLVSFHVRPEGGADEPRDCTLLALDGEDLSAARWAGLRAEGHVVAAVVRVDDRLVVTSPLGAASSICLECVLCSVPRTARDRGRDARVSPVAASLAANQIVYGVFCRFVGIPAEDEHVVRILDCNTLTVKVHRVLPHPLCSLHGRAVSVGPLPAIDRGLVRPDLPSGLDGEELVKAQDALATLVGRWSDAVTGPLLRIGEGDLPQIPLAASECVVQDPGERAVEAPHAVICRGLSARETRSQAVLLALEWSAATLLNLRRGAIDLGVEPVALGIGWSVDEASYRALYHATLAYAPTPRVISGADELRATKPGAHLLELVAERAPSVTFVAAEAPTGMFVATAMTATGVTGRGAGVNEVAAKLHALLDLAIAVTTPEESARAAKLSFEVTSWSTALAAAERRREGRRALLFRAIDGLFPFSAGDIHVVLTGLAHGGR